MPKVDEPIRLTPRQRLELTELIRRLERQRGLPTPEPVRPLLSFRQYVDSVRPKYQWYRHCVQLAAILQDVADDKRSRVMIFEPPRHGKSELASRLFPAYYLYRHPDRWVGLNSYGADLACGLSRAAQGFHLAAAGRVNPRVSAVSHWQTLEGGGMWAAGVGGPITGKGYHLGLIDDPLKNEEEAGSELIRAKQKEWYRSTFYSRQEPHAAIVVIQTRWHEDDLSGWLLESESADDDPERWHVVSMEAIKEETVQAFPASCTVEPDPRETGEALCPERYPVDVLRKIARTAGQYVWSALYQQRPTPPGGGMFKSFPVIELAPPAHWSRVRYWDKAGSQGKGDWTAGVKMAMSPDAEPQFVIEDIVRGQWSAGERERVIADTASLDGKACHVWVEQEPGSGGKESAENTVKRLAGFVVSIDRVTGDKESRARPMAAQAEVGNVKLVRAIWNQTFVSEAQSFPNGKHDDQVDAASGAFNKLALTIRPAKAVATPAVAVPPVPQQSHSMIPGGIPDGLGRGF